MAAKMQVQVVRARHKLFLHLLFLNVWTCEIFKASKFNISRLRDVIGKYVTDDCVAHHHQQVEAFSKKPPSSIPLQFGDKCVSNCCVARLCISHPAVLFTYSHWDGEKWMVVIIWHGYGLVCPATMCCSWDRKTFSDVMADWRTAAYEHITLPLHYGLCSL